MASYKAMRASGLTRVALICAAALLLQACASASSEVGADPDARAIGLAGCPAPKLVTEKGECIDPPKLSWE